jgi:outer membrane protein assembly factor BamE (lipoprotein component of BamABCDE complex)
MIHNARTRFVPFLISAMITTVAFAFMATNASAQKSVANAHAETAQRPLYTDYKGVSLGSTTQDVRAKLGAPAQKFEDQDFYVISEKETVQIAYDSAHTVMAISVDYIGGVGAPDYKSVVGPDVEVQSDGTIHKMVLYEQLGFWVSYHRGAGDAPVVTITIQKMIKR